MSVAVPSSTYRLQIRPQFPLDEAAALVDYLVELGVGAVYLSPVLTAVGGSDHGYDVTDHRRIDPARGGEAGLTALTAAARAAGLDVVVDVVPNHAGVADAAQNPPWWDVLEHGQQSRFAFWFDIEWSQAPLMLPVLGDDVDPSRELRIVVSARTESGYELHYYDKAFPLAPGTVSSADEDVLEVLGRQNYRLAGYRAADDKQNYRRFFAVTELAGLRVEDPAVFEATHEVLLRRVTTGQIAGLRIDHPDGLVDPGAYLDRLRAAAPSAWITVEKIFEPGEVLPAQWPVQGTTGYDALSEIANVLTDPGAAESFSDTYRAVTGDKRAFADHVADGKRGVASTILHAEILRLARLAPDVDGADEALLELAVAFPVYRSYEPLGDEYLAQAVELARSRNSGIGPALDVLLFRLRDPGDELCARFQQVTGAIMAKGVEDTAYYRYTRAIWLNEVGGDPARFGASLADFHDAQQRRQAHAPKSMTTLSTHDTKRGEDVRARLTVLSELPALWADAAAELDTLALLPNKAFGLLLWQTFLGVGFIERERMHAYAEKAMREANDGTNWRDPDAEFEAAVHAAVVAGYDDPAVHAVLQSVLERIVGPGRINSLSAKLIALTMPGVPDVYQGTETWEDSLVDPDNRRAVDFTQRRDELNFINGHHVSLATFVTDQLETPPIDDSGLAKLAVVNRTLSARRDRPELFTSYTPLLARGPLAEHLICYDRGGAIALATRLPVGLAAAGGWANTTLTLGDGQYVDALTGTQREGTVAVADVLQTYPVALLLQTSRTAS